MKSTDYSRTVEVFKGSPWEAELVKGLLENNGIATIIKDGLMSTIAPYITPDVTILVSEETYEDAMEIIRERDKGKAVLVVSFELDEILNLSDRIAVIHDGKIQGIVKPSETNKQELGILMAGGEIKEASNE